MRRPKEPDPLCELNGANPLHYLTELQRHSGELKRHRVHSRSADQPMRARAMWENA